MNNYSDDIFPTCFTCVIHVDYFVQFLQIGVGGWEEVG